jgi:D-alanine transaminase
VIVRPTVAWLHDRIVPWSEAVVPIDDRGLQFGESLYEVLPITAGAPRNVAAHAVRMAHGARALGLEAGVPDLESWRRTAASLIGAEGIREGLLHAQLTGGAVQRNHLARPQPHFFAYLLPHRFPRAAEVACGRRAITLPDERWLHCDYKTTMLLPAVRAKRVAAARGADEALLLGPDGTLREGASSTLFIVARGRVESPAPSTHLLPGTTSGLVAEAAAESGLDVVHGPITVPDLVAAAEVFIAATSLLVMPLVAIDGRAVGDGAPGPVATDLAARIRRRLELAD